MSTIVDVDVVDQFHFWLLKKYWKQAPFKHWNWLENRDDLCTSYWFLYYWGQVDHWPLPYAGFPPLKTWHLPPPELFPSAPLSCLIHWQETAKCAGWCCLWWGGRSVCKNADEFLYKLGAASVAPRVPGGVFQVLAPGSSLGLLTFSAPGRGLLFACLSLCLGCQVLALSFHQVDVFIVNPIWTGFSYILQNRAQSPDL